MKLGYIDNPKKIENTRFLYMNVNGMRSCNEEKIPYFVEACNLYRVECFILTKMNIKQITLIIDKIKSKLKIQQENYNYHLQIALIILLQ